MTADASRARFRRASVAGAAAALVLFLALLTYGRLSFLPTETLGNFYDAQADAFLDGRLDVDPAEASFEGFVVDGRTYIYQGPVPALMRLPVAAVTDRFHGRLTRVSMVAAFVVAMVFVVRLQRRLREVVRGSAPVGRAEAACVALTTFGLGASSLLYLASKAWVYHEAILWGAAFALASLDHLTAALTPRGSGDARASWWHPAWAGAFAGLAVLTRASVGVGPVVALGLAAAMMAVRRRRGHRLSAQRRFDVDSRRTAPARTVLVLVAGAVLPVAAYAALNQAKFGSWFGLPLDKQVLVAFDEDRQAALAANGNSLFSPEYAPSVLLQIVRPDAIGVRGVFPYLGFGDDRPTAVGDVRFAELDWSSSVPASEPLLVLLGLAGVVAVVAPRWVGARGDLGRLRIPAAGGVAAGGTTLVLGYIANRYLTDLLPLLAFTSIIGLHVLVDRAAGRRLVRRGLVVTIGLLAAWGAWANLSLGLQYQREIAPGAPGSSRAAWIVTQSRWGPTPSFLPIGIDDPLPADAPLGTIAVVGQCDGVYRGDGSIWQLVEGAEGVGRFWSDLTFTAVPLKPVDVLTGAGPDGTNRLLLEPAGRGLVRFVASVTRDGEETRSLPGRAFTLDPGRPLSVQLILDWRADYAEVREGGRAEALLGATIDLAAARTEPAADFPGTAVVRRPDLSACEAVGG